MVSIHFILSYPGKYAILIWINLQFEKNGKKVKKMLAMCDLCVYTISCCDIDSYEARGCRHEGLKTFGRI